MSMCPSFFDPAMCYCMDVCLSLIASPGELEGGKAPEKLTPPSVMLCYMPNSSVHLAVLAHVRTLSAVQTAWTVKVNEQKLVTPCGMALIMAKQMIVASGTTEVA